jgi:hypothetical protein
MAKKNTSNKELKPKIEDKKEVAKAFPTSKLVKIKLFKDNKEYSVENSTAKAIIDSKRGELV